MKSSSLLEALPRDSILNLYLEARSILETPTSFDLAIGAATIGSLLRRSCWIDQVHFHVYPNMSVLLVGESGSGKDTAINGARHILQIIESVKIIGGRTSETILTKLATLGDPACGVILAGELSAFFGSKDYQSGLMTDITDLLSTNDYVDISLKKDPDKRIYRPTLTLLGGSTAAWLHKEMPENAMEGGFYPRFLIVCDNEVKRQVPWVKYSVDSKELIRAQQAQVTFIEGLHQILRGLSDIGEMVPRFGAKEAYEQFYVERKKYFSPLVEAYAHRCRDTGLRLATICAVSRLHDYIDAEDVAFAVRFIEYVGARIEEALAPPHLHQRISKDIFKLLPASADSILATLGRKYSHYELLRVFGFLAQQSHQLIEKGGYYHKRV